MAIKILTTNDVDWIRANRTEILTNRTVEVTVTYNAVEDYDPYTGEPIAGEPVTETVAVVWKPVTERDLVNGTEIRKGDVKVSFMSDVNITDIAQILKGGVEYAIVITDERGLGGLNRYECVVRRVS
ncbi:hypothetical protein PghCCS26_47810 [Paenibacillus glycanilyticus]|uniref:Head-tail adaptor protein n=1 Tax=Paenibacillus glycanilyticus TaxID=126569 RepID=A0ABQ6NRE4_9BACL|nr:hypothetical protein [Paenibacillus glycanilyticus]GMK47651.1 hypothetical protein PghCCS26_47810 [Paenibacillus glycanilyticus]